MPAQRLRRWSNIRTSLFQRVVFAGLEAMSAEPISSLYKSACQKLPDSSASPQYTPRLNFEESQIADPVVMLMMMGNNGQDQDEWPHLLVLISPHWIAKRSSPNYITYQRRTVYLFPDPSSLFPDSATAEPAFV